MKEEALLMLHLHIDKREIIDYIKLRSNKKVTHKDLYNWKSIYKYSDNLDMFINKDIILRILGKFSRVFYYFYVLFFINLVTFFSL